MIRKGYFLFLLVLSLQHFSKITYGQFAPWMGDTTKIDKSVKAKPVLIGGLESRVAFFETRPVDITGFSAGFRFNRKHDFTLGYFVLDNNTVRGLWQDKRTMQPLTGSQLRFFAIGYGRVLFNSRFFRLILPFESGFGNATQIISPPGQTIVKTSKFFLPLQAGIYGQWKLTRWIGLGTSIGYRWAIFSGDFPANYNSAYISYGLTFNGYNILEDLVYKKRYKEIQFRKNETK